MSLTAIAVGTAKAVGVGAAAAVKANVGITAATGGMDAVRATLKALAAASDGSLVGATQSARVEPITLIDSTLNGHPSLSPMMQCLQSCFAAYWLQALAMTTNIAGITVAGKLDPLSTSRGPLNSFIVANESYDEKLPMYDGSDMVDITDNEHLMQVAQEAIALEADKNAVEVGKDPGVTDASNLVVGKVLNVTVTNNGASATIPVAIRLACAYMSDDALAGLISGIGADYSFSERLAQLRHGGIRFWRDFILCQDIIDEHRKNLANDKTGIYLQMMERRASNNKATVASAGKVSLNNASNMVILAKETLEIAENKLGINFNNYNQRQKIFQEGYMMIIAVMDRRWSRVTIYTRGIKDTTTVSFADLKNAAKGDGPDVADILSAFRAGTSAVL